MTTQVLIVGAGPVGLMLACELRRAGVRVTIAERLPAPMRESRASLLNTCTAELLHARGFDSLLDPAQREMRTHFAGLPIDLSATPSDYAGNFKMPQYVTEQVLGDEAARAGVTLLRSHELREIREAGDRVACVLDGPAGRGVLEAEYVIGCDGAASTVRRLAGFGTARRTATRELLRADVAEAGIPDRRFERHEGGFAVASTRRGVTRVMMYVRGQEPVSRQSPPAFSEVASSWKQVTGEDISHCEALWIDSFDNSYGQADRYRRGRVLLAGDAAHWHMPIGGQALNVGLSDAVNLGWKLAAVLTGWAPSGLLDTYGTERHAAAARVIRHVAAQETLLLGGAEVESLRHVLSESFALEEAQHFLGRFCAGLDDQYGTRDDGVPAGRHMAHLRPGRAPAVMPSDLLTGAHAGVLVRFADPGQGGDPAGRGPDAQSVTLASGAPLRIVRVAQRPLRDGITDVLLRPDAYIAWAGADQRRLSDAVSQWFGAPLPDGHLASRVGSR
jgi:2-polyprenyl-6-methoxyphenol hydroxylase-like FAD-dependent oxidoreductase